MIPLDSTRIVVIGGMAPGCGRSRYLVSCVCSASDSPVRREARTVARLVLLSGPSCVGKGPLVSALRRHHPELAAQLVPLVLHNSRVPRPGEADGVDYHFRSRAEIERLASSPGFVACDVRGDFQGLELAMIEGILDSGHDAFFEGNPFIPEMLREAGVLDQYPTLTVFLSPLTRDEIVYLRDPARRVDLASFVADVMRRKLLARTVREKTICPNSIWRISSGARPVPLQSSATPTDPTTSSPTTTVRAVRIGTRSTTR
jgi:guanylate kinase